MPGSPAYDPPVGRSITRVLQLKNTGHAEDSLYELVRLSLLVKQLREIEAARPDLIPSLAKRLLTDDVSAYIGAREEIAVASSLVRKGREFTYEPPDGPDFLVTVAGGVVGIECTSTHLPTSIATPHIYVRDEPELGGKDIAYKLARPIRAKEKRPYAATHIALSIEASNLWALSASPGPSMTLAEEALAAGSYGAALFHSLIYDVENQAIGRNYVRRDSPNGAPILVRFLDEHFPKGSVEVEEPYVTPLVP